MKNIFLVLLLCSSCLCKGQYISIDSPKYAMIKKDTINIRGVVLDAFNNPAKNIFVVSKNKEIKFYGLPIYTRTGNDGKFELDGALVTDTLEIWWRKKISLINNGSRYLEIRLPDAPADSIKVSGSVTANRTVKKKAPPTFKVLINATVMDYFGVSPTLVASYPGGIEKFAGIINEKLIYPKKAIENNIEGEVEIGFSIERDGSTGNFHVIKGMGYGCEEAVIDAIKMTCKWRPGILNGMPIITNSSVTINFKLTDN
jgi:TonB family protein